MSKNKASAGDDDFEIRIDRMTAILQDLSTANRRFLVSRRQAETFLFSCRGRFDNDGHLHGGPRTGRLRRYIPTKELQNTARRNFRRLSS